MAGLSLAAAGAAGATAAAELLAVGEALFRRWLARHRSAPGSEGCDWLDSGLATVASTRRYGPNFGDAAIRSESAAQTMHQAHPVTQPPDWACTQTRRYPPRLGRCGRDVPIFRCSVCSRPGPAVSTGRQCRLFSRVPAPVSSGCLQVQARSPLSFGAGPLACSTGPPVPCERLRACNSDGVHWSHIGDECALLFPCGRSHGG